MKYLNLIIEHKSVNTYSSGKLLRMQFKWVSCTPFGMPVVPEEYKMNAMSTCPWTCIGSNLFMSTSFVTNVLIEITDSRPSSRVINFSMQSKLSNISLYVCQKKLEHIKYFGFVILILCFNTAKNQKFYVNIKSQIHGILHTILFLSQYYLTEF